MFNSRLRILCVLMIGALALSACSSDSSSAAAETNISTTASDDPPTTAPETQPSGNDAVEDIDDNHDDESTDTKSNDTDHEADEGTEDDHADDADADHEEVDDHPVGTAGNADPADAVVTISVEMAGGLVVGGAQRYKVATADVVLIEVALGQAGEVHLHGYDFVVEGESGETIQIAFVADIPGVWELELEGPGIELLELEVS